MKKISKNVELNADRFYYFFILINTHSTFGEYNAGTHRSISVIPHNNNNNLLLL